MPKAIRFAPSLLALLLGCSALSSGAQAGWFSSDPTPVAKADDKAKAAPQPAATLEDSIHQAQMLRLAGNYDEAINHLSQLMLVAADDGRVISEYGKTLVAKGRAEEGEKFLARAEQLQPNDWTIYSALGVAYDEIGKPKEAQASYEHALALKPGEPSVLSNYALSRMLAKDPVMARKLADRAEAANAAASDNKIARNIAMIRSIAPQASDSVATGNPAPSQAPVSAPRMAVATAPLTPVQNTQPPAAKPAPKPALVTANAAAHALTSSPPPRPQAAPAASQAPNGVVMQPVPVDPLAGPVDKAATHAPRSLQPKPAQAGSEAPVKTLAKTELPKPELSKPATEIAKTTAPVERATAKTEAKAPIKPLPVKPVPAKVEVAKATPPAAPAAQVSLPVKAMDVKAANVKPGAPPTAPKVLPPASVKVADVKPGAAQAVPKALPSTPVKAADTKPAATKTAAAAKPAPKDTIPGLRLSANAY
ncbi:MAG TPA: tetratricopeptide repeat protein [Rhizomicrobium sp.]|nr:tetratricopeptide repeat protein [Rhizomicrobium sp.]